MDKFEFEYIKTMILRDNGYYSYEEVSMTADVLESNFGFNTSELEGILFECPNILKVGATALRANLEKLAETYNLKSKEFRYLVLCKPFVLLLSYEALKYKFDLLSTVFALKKQDVIKRVTLYPELLFLSKKQIVNQVITYSFLLDEFGHGVRRIFSLCPMLLLTDKQQVNTLMKVLISGFTFSARECIKIFKAVPDLMLTSADSLKNLLDFYYPRYFVKRDLKEMIPSCPELLTLSPKTFNIQLQTVMNVLSLSEKDALVFIRNCPHLLFYPNVKNKLEGFKKFNINLEFVKIHPNILMSPEISIPLKFVLSRMLGLDSGFEEVCRLSTRTFIARFLFMQESGNFNHQDLLLSDEEFKLKYGISSQALKVNYKTSIFELKSILEYYLSLKGKLPMWSDIVFPEVVEVSNYLKEKNSMNVSRGNFDALHTEYLLTKSEYELTNALASLHLECDECLYLIKRCKYLCQNGNYSLLKCIDILKKQGIMLEDIIKLLLLRPSLFTYHVTDFDIVLNEAIDFYLVEPVKALDYM